MDFLELDQRVMKLLTSGQFDSAEAELHQARLQASERADRYTLEQVLSSLVELYCTMQPSDLTKAESYSLERERISGTGQAKLETAMLLYWSMHNPSRTVTKVQEAITAASQERDDMTVYQSFGLLGLALLDLHQNEEACGCIACHQIGIKPVIQQDHTKEFAIGAGPVREINKILPVFLKQRAVVY